MAVLARHRSRHDDADGGSDRRSARRPRRRVAGRDQPARDDVLVHLPVRGLSRRARARGRRGARPGVSSRRDREAARRDDHRDPAGPGQPAASAPPRRCRRCSMATSHPYGRPAKGHDRDRRAAVPRRSARVSCASRFARVHVAGRSSATSIRIAAFERIDRGIRRTGTRRRRGSRRAAGRRRCDAAPCRRLRCRASRRPTSPTASSASAVSIPAYCSYWVMNNILGQFGLGGRLAENIRERQGMAYYAFSAFDPSLGPGPLVIRAGVDPAQRRARDRGDRRRGRRIGRDGSDRAGTAGDAAVPDRLDPADARNQPEHRDVPADRRSSSVWGSTTIGSLPRSSRVR